MKVKSLSVLLFLTTLVGCVPSHLERIEEISVSSDADFVGQIVNINKEGELILIELYVPRYDMPVEVFVTEETEIYDTHGNKINSYDLKRNELVEVWTEVQFGAFNMAIKIRCRL